MKTINQSQAIFLYTEGTMVHKAIIPLVTLEKIIQNCKESNVTSLCFESKSNIRITFLEYEETRDTLKQITDNQLDKEPKF
jgi:uncharacterized Fe-S cluster-containing MiaB family protein